MTGSVNLHELANAPGFGRARKALIEAGAFDIYADAGPLRTFSVLLSAETRVYATISVNARCEAEAEALAKNRATQENGIDWRLGGSETTDFMPEETIDRGRLIPGAAK